MKESISLLRETRGKIQERADVLETELDSFGASEADAVYLDNLQRLVELLTQIIILEEKQYKLFEKCYLQNNNFE